MSSNTQKNNSVEAHPKASYEQVVEDESVFMETLQDLHKSLGTKFSLPKIGGHPLDLHRLFVEVTSRGGLRKVIGDRNWKEVTSAFTFPSTITSASFVLRKYYISLLQTYEQFYYFRKKHSKPPSNDTKVGKVPEAPSGTPVHRNKTVEEPTSEQPPIRVGTIVKGKINGKFENGYLITATIGSETLNGVMYYVPVEQQNQPLYSQGNSRKRSRKVSDLSHLKPNDRGYNLFFDELYSKVMPLYSGKEKVIIKHINSLWNKLTESEKEVYRERDEEPWQTSTSEY